MHYQANIIKHIFTPTSAGKSQGSNAIQHPALGIYHNNYVENGVRALAITYRTVFALMEESDFRRLATAYLLKYPKTCFDWADYGEQLASFMFEIEALADLPFLPELAELDWRLMHIERAPNKRFQAESFNLLQKIELQKLAFEPAPGLQTMKAYFPLFELYTAIHKRPKAENDLSSTNEMPPMKEINKLINDAINNAINNAQHRFIVLWREQHKGLFEYCSDISSQAFDSILRGNSIAEVLSHFGENQSAMTSWLQMHIQSKKIYAVHEII